MGYILGFVLGWLASFSAGAFYDLGKRPVMEIDVGNSVEGESQKGGKYRLSHITISNKKARWPWRLVTNRQVAWGCEVIIGVYNWEKDTKAISDNIIGRWSSTPEPVQDIAIQTPSGESVVIKWPDNQKLPVGRKLDLIPGKPESVPVAIKFEQSECYMFSNESYLSPNTPSASLRWQEWELLKEKYKIVVTVHSGSYSKSETFVLMNDGKKRESLRLIKSESK